MAELIRKEDTLNQGREKLNEAIKDAETAKGKSESADVKATQALAKSESTQTQLDTIVIEGDSSVEAAQARVPIEGEAYPTLKARLDAENAEVTAQLAETDEKTNRNTNILIGEFSPVEYEELNTEIDGVIDYTPAIKEAIKRAEKNGGKVKLPPKRMNIFQTIYIPEAVDVEGTSLPDLWSNNNPGTVIDYYGTGVAFQISEDIGRGIKCVGLSKVRINDKLGTGRAGIVIGGDATENSTSDISLNRIVVEGFDYGYIFQRAYGISVNLLVSKSPRRDGYWLKNKSNDGSVSYGGMTLSSFTSSGVYNAVNGNGFLIERDITYSSFDQCYADGVKIGFKMTGFTRNGDLFAKCGVESYSEYAFYFDNLQTRVGLESPFITLPKAGVKDNIYFNGNRLFLKNIEIPSAYSPTNGFDVNVNSGVAYLTNAQFDKIKGKYRGTSVPQRFLAKTGSPKALDATVVEVPTSGNVTKDARLINGSILGKSINNDRALILSSGQEDQEVTIYGMDDEHKLKLRTDDFPALPNYTYLGKGDYVRLVYKDLGDGLKWHLLEYKTHRFESTPPSQYFWERGRIFYNKNPSSGGSVGWVCITSGTPGTWKSFGNISQ